MINVKQYRDPDLAINDDVIGFYPREFYPLDNFQCFAIIWNGKRYPSSEHLYQASAFFETNPRLAEEIRLAMSAHDAQKIARKNKKCRPNNWDNIKVNVMKNILKAKLEQHPYVKQKLLETKDYIIVEDSPKDSFWGWGYNHQGQNQLGKLWMEIREEIRT